MRKDPAYSELSELVEPAQRIKEKHDSIVSISILVH
jgi:hypothetical protein